MSVLVLSQFTLLFLDFVMYSFVDGYSCYECYYFTILQYDLFTFLLLSLFKII